MSHTTSPSLHTDDCVALVEHAETDCVADSPLETAVDVFLPGGLIEVGLLFSVVEGVDAAVKVGVSGGAGIASDHDDRADRSVFGDETGCVAAVQMLVRVKRRSALKQLTRLSVRGWRRHFARAKQRQQPWRSSRGLAQVVEPAVSAHRRSSGKEWQPQPTNRSRASS